MSLMGAQTLKMLEQQKFVIPWIKHASHLQSLHMSTVKILIHSKNLKHTKHYKGLT